jgi:pyruvate dehydrogenase complex dehydrogenase (E1) component
MLEDVDPVETQEWRDALDSGWSLTARTAPPSCSPS